MGTFEQVRLLVWKNWQLQRKQPKGMVVQMCLPMIYFVLLVIMRGLVSNDTISASSGASMGAAVNTARVKYTSSEFDWSFDPPAEQDNQFSMWRKDYDTPVNLTRIIWAPKSKNQNTFMMVFCEAWVQGRSIGGTDFRDIEFEGFDTEEELPLTDPDVLAAIVFKEDDGTGGKSDQLYGIEPCAVLGPGCNPRVHIEIRMSPSIAYTSRGTGWATDRNIPEWPSEGPFVNQQTGPYTGYHASAFLTLQSMMTDALAFYYRSDGLTLGVTPLVATRIKPMPHPEWEDNSFLSIAKATVGTFLVLTYLYTCQSSTRAIVEEKEKRLKEAMKMMGLSSWVHWLAWWIKIWLVMLPSIIGLTILCVVGDLFPKTDPGILFFFFLLYATSTIGFSFFLSSFFFISSCGISSIRPTLLLELCSLLHH